MQSTTLTAPAKINHFLRIGAKMPNGLHAIESWMQKISLADTIEVEITSAKNAACELHLHPDADFVVPTKETNLIHRAIALYFAGKSTPPFRITLDKKIPIGAGLGGGSSDAAAILRFLQTHFPDPRQNIVGLAANLGSDVPFFVEETAAALVSGTGERLAPHSPRPGVVVLVKPHDLAIETAWAYRTFDEDSHKKQPEISNDFEPCIFAQFPKLAEIKRNLLASGAQSACLSGSGATVFGIFEDEELALAAQKRFDAKTYWSYLGHLLV